MEEHIMYEFQYKTILETLRLCGNMINSSKRESCLARMVESSKRMIENALKDSHQTFVSNGGYNTELK